jgi:hypothetical protein
MKTMIHYLTASAIAILAMNSLEAQELDVEQQTAKTIFENNLFDAQEKLQELKLNTNVMTWEWYEEWTITPLQRSIVEAQRTRVPPTTPIGFDKPVPFSVAVQQAARIEQEFRTAFKQKDDPLAVFRNGQTPENLKRYERFRAQYTRGLSGDKLRIMSEEVLVNAVVYAQDPPKFFIAYYGDGKKLLTTPADFANASVWATADYAYASDDPLKRDPHWRADVHHFNGMKLLKTTSHRGAGKVAPEAVFH